ncbi:MAG TPA: GNAT family N-acetyltransferase [Jiangellales bacterium]|nr:GNAT family N-acetyltransferase [Jiangellales bacterium]
MGVQLHSVNPTDDDAIDAYHRIVAASWACDLPDFPTLTRDQVAAMIRHPFPSKDRYYFIVRRSGEVVGAVEIALPTADNHHLAEVELSVHPDRRRRGIGRETFAELVQFAREHGRALLVAEYCVSLKSGPERSAAPAAFAESVGAKPALPEVRRRLDLATVDPDDWRARYEDALAQAKGYSPVWWSGPAPDDVAADVAYLEGRMVGDAPMGELRYEPENYDAARIQATDETFLRRGTDAYNAGVRDDETGRLVGWSAIHFEVGETTHAWQGTTIIDPNHRGHRLGLLVKLENLIRVREVQPALRYVDTWNAEENTHMIAINEAIGFRPVDGWVACQYDVP